MVVCSAGSAGSRVLSRQKWIDTTTGGKTCSRRSHWPASEKRFSTLFFLPSNQRSGRNGSTAVGGQGCLIQRDLVSQVPPSNKQGAVRFPKTWSVVCGPETGLVEGYWARCDRAHVSKRGVLWLCRARAVAVVVAVAVSPGQAGEDDEA